MAGFAVVVLASAGFAADLFDADWPRRDVDAAVRCSSEVRGLSAAAVSLLSPGLVDAVSGLVFVAAVVVVAVLAVIEVFGLAGNDRRASFGFVSVSFELFTFDAGFVDELEATSDLLAGAGTEAFEEAGNEVRAVLGAFSAAAGAVVVFPSDAAVW